MLKNELKNIEEILIEQIYSDSNTTAQTDLKIRFGQIYKAWEEVLFSHMPESSLVRYFHYHLDVISNISDQVSHFPNPGPYFSLQKEFLALIDHLQKYYCKYFNEDAIAPLWYHKRLVSQLAENICAIQERLQSGGTDPALLASLSKWFGLMSDHIGKVWYSFRSLHYFEYIINQLSEIVGLSTEADTPLVSLLVSLNFNHLSFLVYLQCFFLAVPLAHHFGLLYIMSKAKIEEDSEHIKEVLKLVGARIRSLREAKGERNYEKFAFKHDLNRMQLWRYENGEDLYFSSLLKVLAALDITLAEFFGKGLMILRSDNLNHKIVILSVTHLVPSV